MYRNKITKYGLFITKDIFYNQLIFRVKKQLEGLENLRFNIDNHKDLLYDIFLNRYRDRISRFDNWAAHFDKMTEIFVDNYPSLSRQIWVAQDKEWADILTRKGYRIKSVAKSDNKSESDNSASVSSTPGDYSTNEMDEMIQSFNKNKSIVDTKGNTISDTEQYDLFNQLSKMVNIHIPRIFNNWIINFDKLFSNFDYQGDWAPCDIKNRYVFNFIYEYIQENLDMFKGPPGKDGKPGITYNELKPKLEQEESLSFKGREFSFRLNPKSKPSRSQSLTLSNVDYSSGENTYIRVLKDDVQVSYQTPKEYQSVVPKIHLEKYVDMMTYPRSELYDKKDIDTKLSNKVDKKDLVIDSKGKWNQNISILDMNGRNIEKIGVLSFTNSVSLWTSDNKILNFKDNTLRGVKRIEGLNEPINNQDAANKKYVDDKTKNAGGGGSIFKKSSGGGEYSKIDKLPLGMNQSRISELKDPVSDDDAATKRYVDSKTTPIGGGSDFDIIQNNSTKKRYYFKDKNTTRKVEYIYYIDGILTSYELNDDGMAFRHWGQNESTDKDSIPNYNVLIEMGYTETEGNNSIRGINRTRFSDHVAHKAYVDKRILLMFQELGFPKDKVQAAYDKIETEYQLLFANEKKA